MLLQPPRHSSCNARSCNHPAASLQTLQVNPLAETDTELVAADAKLGFDDNASFRQQDLFAMRDESQEDPRWVFYKSA